LFTVRNNQDSNAFQFLLYSVFTVLQYANCILLKAITLATKARLNHLYEAMKQRATWIPSCGLLILLFGNQKQNVRDHHMSEFLQSIIFYIES